jgi:hypothetical protein
MGEDGGAAVVAAARAYLAAVADVARAAFTGCSLPLMALGLGAALSGLAVLVHLLLTSAW